MPPALTVTLTSVTYYHENDETSFFGWLDRMNCVGSYRGEGQDLIINLVRRPNKSDMQELLAFFFRYQIDMSQLLAFETKSTRDWLRDPGKYWYEGLIRRGS